MKSINNKSKHIEYLFTEIAKAITSSLEITEVFDTIMHQVEVFFSPSNWSLLMVDEAKQQLYFKIAKGLETHVIKNVRLKIGEGIAGHVAAIGMPILVKNVKSNPYFSSKLDKLSRFKTRSIVAVPIMFQKKVLGVIELINSIEHKEFTQKDLKLLEVIADFSAIALSNARAFDQITKLTRSDALTGVYNRIYLNKILKEIDLLSKSEDPIKEKYVIAAWIDVDNFKQVNDRYGHDIGDKILCNIGTSLKKLCRKNDLVFRVGGDEFLILIMNCDRSNIDPTVKRLENKLSLSARVDSTWQFSFGIAYGLQIKLREVIIEADGSMYLDKSKKKSHHFIHSESQK